MNAQTLRDLIHNEGKVAPGQVADIECEGKPADAAMVFGCGPVGLAVIAALRLAGAERLARALPDAAGGGEGEATADGERAEDLLHQQRRQRGHRWLHPLPCRSDLPPRRSRLPEGRMLLGLPLLYRS